MNNHYCRLFLQSKADACGIELDISEEPFTTGYPEFPAEHYTCPHGTDFWLQPTPTEAARLRGLNGMN